MSGKPRGERHIGLLNGFAAYGMWGLFPLFFPLLKPADPFEVLAHRMVWSLVAVALALLVIRRCASPASSRSSRSPRRSSPSTGASTSGP